MNMVPVAGIWCGRICRAAVLILLLVVSALPPAAAADPAASGVADAPYVVTEDGELSKLVGLPTFEWLPKGTEPKGMALAIHGLTLHGGRYELLGRAFAAGGYYLVAPDMRGFGRCRTDVDGKRRDAGDRRGEVDYDKSYEDLVGIAGAMKHKFPKLRLIVIGESLGATMAVRIAGEHPELVDGLLISGPAMRIHPSMLFQPVNLFEGLMALLVKPSGAMNLGFFMKKLISADPGVVQEVSKDPLVRKHLTIGELLKTYFFVAGTRGYARKVKRELPVLVLQGSLDRCVVPYAVVDLCRNIRSADQTLRWLDNHSHLMLETSFMKGAAIRAITDWFENHEPARLEEMKQVEDKVRELGGSVSE